MIQGDHRTHFSVKKKSSDLEDWADMKVSKQGGKLAPNNDNLPIENEETYY